MTHAQASAIPDSQIRTTFFGMAFWDGDDGEWLETWEHDVRYRFYNGNDLMVSPSCLVILSLATGGRMTAERIWRMGTYQGEITGASYRCYSFSGIDYYGLEFLNSDPRQDLPEATPGFPLSFFTEAPMMAALIALESLGDVELVRQAIIWKGKLWLWMPPC